MLVFNNRKGVDAELLARFREPAWNNPVVRYLDGKGGDILPRRDGIWTLGGTVGRMVAALEAADRDVPSWLRALLREATPKRRAEVAFAMACFWEGEARLGRLDGVLATEAGWLAGREVVRVTFDADRVSLGSLVKEARRLDCARAVHVEDPAAERDARKAAGGRLDVRVGFDGFRPADESDRKHFLRRDGEWSGVRLTPWQRTRVNAALRFREDPAPFVSPRQRRQAGR